MNDAATIVTAELIADYNKATAAAYLAQPFQRVNLALAFARGFKGPEVHPVASLVLRHAYLDRDLRAMNKGA